MFPFASDDDLKDFFPDSPNFAPFEILQNPVQLILGILLAGIAIVAVWSVFKNLGVLVQGHASDDPRKVQAGKENLIKSLLIVIVVGFAWAIALDLVFGVINLIA